MSAPKDGGPAFPIPVANTEQGLTHSFEYGMSLRDYFAGKALVGWLTGAENPPPPESTAKRCYAYADAMLAARGTPTDRDLVTDLVGALQTTAENIRSQQAAHPGVTVWDSWLQVVEAALKKARPE